MTPAALSKVQRCSLSSISLYGMLLILATVTAEASDRLNWPARTGPGLNSLIPANDAAGLPTEWSEDPSKNIAWKLDLEGFGHSVPVVGFGKIWLTAATKDGKQQFIYCIEQSTGKVLHHKLMYENAEPEPLKNEVNTYASPSCALEKDAVYVHFGTYGTARLNPETAEVVWERKDIKCRHFRGPGSSPIVWMDHLILTFDGIDAQFVMALDKHTGKTVWRTDRTTDYGDLDENGQPKLEGDLRKAYSTPGYVDVNGRTHLISIGSRAAFAYDALTGEELWTIRHDDFNASSPPMFFESHAILNTGSRGSNLLSVRLDETTRGDVSQSHVVWNRDKGNSDLSAPILIGDRIFSVLNNGVVNCVNVKTGEEIWKDRIEGTFTASPIAGDGRIYFCNEEGDCYVVEASDSFKLISKNHLSEGMRASPSAADGHLFLRTFTRLYCIGK
jgi:outer membrane protein assembly factor BamB